MTKKQLALKALIQEIYNFFEANNDEWSSKMPIANAYGQFRSVADKIKLINVSQRTQDTKGHTLKLNEYKKRLKQLCYNLTLKMAAYARFKHDTVLLESVDIRVSELSRLRVQNLIAECQIIHSQAVKVQAESTDYQIKNEELDEVLYLINSLTEIIVLRNSIGDTRTLITAEIFALEKNCFSLLANLDHVITAFAENENFKKAYFQVRKLEDLNTRKRVKVLELEDM